MFRGAFFEGWFWQGYYFQGDGDVTTAPGSTVADSGIIRPRPVRHAQAPRKISVRIFG